MKRKSKERRGRKAERLMVRQALAYEPLPIEKLQDVELEGRIRETDGRLERLLVNQAIEAASRRKP